MRTLVIGSRGSMGKRYCAILRYLKQDFQEWDLGMPSLDGQSFERVIVATPTETHFDVLMRSLLNPGVKSILCEKPVCTEESLIYDLMSRALALKVDIHMVCNWKYAINLALTRAKKTAVAGGMDIEYNYYNSGKDGFFWDAIQLLYLAGTFKYDRTRPAFECFVNGIEVNLGHIEESYVLMVSEWLYGDSNKLWGLGDAIKANRKVQLAIGLCVNPQAGAIHFGRTDK